MIIKESKDNNKEKLELENKINNAIREEYELMKDQSTTYAELDSKIQQRCKENMWELNGVDCKITQMICEIQQSMLNKDMRNLPIR